MNSKIIRYYLFIIPIYSLVGIILSIYRTVFQENYLEIFLLVGAVFDFLIVIIGRKYLVKKEVLFVVFLMFFSLVAGILNENEVSRRYITDFTNPLFFFTKIFVFSLYWETNSFDSYLKYYIKISFWGSIILLPITYFIFIDNSVSRLAIFPPMELPFSFFMQKGGLFFLFSVLVIFLYGKRAQLVGSIFTFLIFLFVFNFKKIHKYIPFLILGTIVFFYLLQNFTDNLAVQRLTNTIDQYFESLGGQEVLANLSSGRDEEIKTILEKMKGVDYITGKGLGFTYEVQTRDYIKEVGNVHFSPLSFLSKYGLIFTLFIYIYIVSNMLKYKNYKWNISYISAYGTVVFVFVESFFAYALFVTPIFPIVFGYIIFKNKFIS